MLTLAFDLSAAALVDAVAVADDYNEYYFSATATATADVVAVDDDNY